MRMKTIDQLTGIGPQTDQLLREEILILEDFFPNIECESPYHHKKTSWHGPDGTTWFYTSDCLCPSGFRCDRLKINFTKLGQRVKARGGQTLYCKLCDVEFAIDSMVFTPV